MSNHSHDPGYQALRLGADWASAVRGSTIYFDYGRGDQRLAITQPAPRPAPEGPVRVSTPPSAHSRPRVTAITLGTDRGAITLTGCSAAFWSESAVEKFLLPYYASAAGPHAREVLADICAAWYGYDEKKPVCALTFQYSPEAMVGPLSLRNTVGVVFATQDAAGEPMLAMLPLPEYLKTINLRVEPAPLSPPVPVPTVPAERKNEPTPVDSVGAREVAEYVSGLRGQKVRVYQSEQEIGGLEPVLAAEGGGSGEPLFTAQATVVRPDRPTVSVEVEVEVKVEVEGAEWTQWVPLTAIGGSPANNPDSAFWTDGAVEMLMLPYYASVKGYGAPWYLTVLLGKWAGTIPADIVDAVELVPQIIQVVEEGLKETGAEILRQAVEELEGEPEPGLFTTDVFGLVHLPRSEYVDEVVDELVGDVMSNVRLESIALESRTWFLTLGGNYPLVSPRRRLVPPR